VVVVVAALGTVALREATMSRHRSVDPETMTELVVRASSNEPRANLRKLIEALFLRCELEVATDPVGPPERLDDQTFRLLVAPELDDTDRRQMAGCLEDADIDHLQAKVLSMRHTSEDVPLPATEPPADRPGT
jgi:hypothetical protein